jgi:hypothetical protein
MNPGDEGLIGIRFGKSNSTGQGTRSERSVAAEVDCLALTSIRRYPPDSNP